ncbi:LysR family transcriptional regulator, partial [Bacillus subtilis]
LIEPVIRRTLGLVFRKDDTLSPAADKFREVLMKLWSQDNTSPWVSRFSR